MIEAKLSGLITREPYAVPRYKKWIEDDRPVTRWALDRVTEMKLDPTDRSDGKGRLRGSMLGECIRRQALSFHGVKPSGTFDARTLQAFTTGHMMHAHWQEAGLSAGWLVDIEIPVHNPEWKFAGLMDGMLDNGWVFEFKSCNQWKFDDVSRSGPDAGHMLQINGYMHTINAPAGSLVYQNKATGDCIEFVVEPDPKLADYIQRMSEAITSSTIESLPPVPVAYSKDPANSCITHTGSEYKRCRWADVCVPERSGQ